MNKTGKGGFQDHPELVNVGGRPKNQQSLTYWLHHFLDMSVAEFREYENKTSDKDRTVAESVAYARMHAARGDLRTTEYVHNRTEGMSTQPLSNADGSNLELPVVYLPKEEK